MSRVVPLALTALLVLASTLGAVATVGAATAPRDPAATSHPFPAATNTTTTTDGNTTTTNDTTDGTDAETDIPPGARLAGIVGAQQAEYESEVETRALGYALGAGASNSTKAAALANYTERIRERIQVLEDRIDRLEVAYENGTISQGAYYGQSTALTARIRALERLANRTVERARTLPQEELAQHGVNVTELESIRENARALGNSKAARAAEMVAGPAVGHPIGKDDDHTPPGLEDKDRTPPGQADDRPTDDRPADVGGPNDDDDATNETATAHPNGSQRGGDDDRVVGPPDHANVPGNDGANDDTETTTTTEEGDEVDALSPLAVVTEPLVDLLTGR
ncbi:MAG: hypothetical protein ABEJ67_01360 [Halanaeroarchaeum sp.]